MQFTDKHIANLREAITMWETVPPENVATELSYWRDNWRSDPPNCNTIACLGGWVAWWPAFRAQGVICERGSGKPLVPGSLNASAAAYALFGESSLFGQRQTEEGPGTDHEVVMRRLRKTLARALAERKVAA